MFCIFPILSRYVFAVWFVFFFSSRRRHTRCALVTGVRRVLFRSERRHHRRDGLRDDDVAEGVIGRQVQRGRRLPLAARDVGEAGAVHFGRIGRIMDPIASTPAVIASSTTPNSGSTKYRKKIWISSGVERMHSTMPQRGTRSHGRPYIRSAALRVGKECVSKGRF